MLAYLVIRDGAKWTDVFRLIPGQTVTVGRANTNQIVLRDERCSRYHAEIFLAQGRWVVRDLDSRNGTLVDNHPIRGDFVLSPGEVVRIGRSQLAFVHDLAKAFPDSSSLIVKEFKADYQEPTIAAVETQPLPAPEAWSVIAKRDQTSLFDAPDPAAPSPERETIAARLSRVQAELHSANDSAALRDAALDTLVQFLDWEGGSIHLSHSEGAAQPTPDDLDLAVARTSPGKNLVSCPAPLIRQAFGERAALLVRFGDIKPFADASTAGPAKRLAIVTPIGRGEQTLGLLYVYSGEGPKESTEFDLDFALALADVLGLALQNLQRRQELAGALELSRDENHHLRRQIGVVSGLMGKSLGLSRVTEAIVRAAASTAPVLISGESGVGKELVARSIHSDSRRANGPFVSVHCGAYSEDELAMELWGVEGALGDRPEQVGKYEAASGGTLLLDEIGELSAPLQEKVLRLLENHPLRRLGGHEPLEVDVRLIATTSRDLNADVAAGRFRHDLFVRLKAEEIPVPALQRRPEDLPELSQHFLEHFAQDIGKRITGFTPAALDRMSRYRWPGNVRELRNVIERAVLLARRPLVDALDILLPSSIAAAGEPLTLEEAERRHLQAVLDHVGWNLDDAAKKLGIDKVVLQRKIDGVDLTKSG